MGALCDCNERRIIELKEVILGIPRYMIMPLPTVDMCAGVFSWVWWENQGVCGHCEFSGQSIHFSGHFLWFCGHFLVDKTFTLVDIFSCFVDKIRSLVDKIKGFVDIFNFVDKTMILVDKTSTLVDILCLMEQSGVLRTRFVNIANLLVKL